MKFKLILFVKIILILVTLTSCNLVKIACYGKDDLINFTIVEDPTYGKSATNCVEECKKRFHRLAGLLGGNTCLCGEVYKGVQQSNNCNIPCSLNRHETCGGVMSASIYEATGSTLGAPRNLNLMGSSTTGLRIRWDPPFVGLSKIEGFEVTASPLFTYNERMPPGRQMYKYSSVTKTALLDDLSAGTKYKINIIAESAKGKGYPAILEAWTEVGIPEEPEIPKIMSRSSSKMVVQLKKLIPTGGPISSYQIVVVDETLHVNIDFDSLYGFSNATRLGLPYYIAAEFKKDQLGNLFTVGNRKIYGAYYNAPLRKNVDYHILLGITSTINKTKSSYSLSTHDQHDHIAIHDHGEDEDHHVDGTVIGMFVGVGLLGFFLFVSVFVYIALRIFIKKSRKTNDHQELAVHAHSPNCDYENGFAVGVQGINEEEFQTDHYSNLKEKVAIISHHSVRIVGDLGVGSYGQVKKAVLMNKEGQQQNVFVHEVEDSLLQPEQKSQMLKDFDNHIKLGLHVNVICLLGLMEEINRISVICNYESATLKSFLEDSRAVKHYPVYAEKNRRFSTIQEKQVFHILGGIASGLAHLHSLKIPHGQLCARNIVLQDKIIPKISGFGLLSNHNNVYIPDYTRWKAPEVLRSNKPNCPADIWSMGCVMWECATLGGTPYADVRTGELQNRITKGLRLAQLQYVSDDFYQLMLLCWQNDPGERPLIAEIVSFLKNLETDEITPHLLFSLFSSFAYEPYSPHLEFLD